MADSRARTLTMQERHYFDNPEFYLMQARARVSTQKDAANSILHFEQLLKSNTHHTEAAQYGLALAYIEQKKYREAKDILRSLLHSQPNYLPYVYSSIEADIANQAFDQALTSLEQQLSINQNNYPLLRLQAEACLLYTSDAADE